MKGRVRDKRMRSVRLVATLTLVLLGEVDVPLFRFARDHHGRFVSLVHANLEIGQHARNLVNDIEQVVLASGALAGSGGLHVPVSDRKAERKVSPGEGRVRLEVGDSAAELGRREGQEREDVVVDLVVLVDEDDPILHHVAPPDT